MLKKINKKILEWECKKNLIIIKGFRGKAFRASGDILEVAKVSLKGNKQVGKDFFKLLSKTFDVVGFYKIP